MVKLIKMSNIEVVGMEPTSTVSTESFLMRKNYELNRFKEIIEETHQTKFHSYQRVHRLLFAYFLKYRKESIISKLVKPCFRYRCLPRFGNQRNVSGCF